MRRLTEEAVTLDSLVVPQGNTKERVHQNENRALEKLRRALSERHSKEALGAVA